ncbi:hypothetical protein BDV97DRAFT_413276 [Delphinella strobiligena]|nr:hypothetical protein BDV97DRAFT_413276 [Delphinella strobiligena]
MSTTPRRRIQRSRSRSQSNHRRRPRQPRRTGGNGEQAPSHGNSPWERPDVDYLMQCRATTPKTSYDVIARALGRTNQACRLHFMQESHRLGAVREPQHEPLAYEDHDLQNEVTRDDLAGAHAMMAFNTPQARPSVDLLRSYSSPDYRDRSPLRTVAPPGRQRLSLPSMDVLLQSIRDENRRRDSAVMMAARDANLRRSLADQQIHPQMTALEHRRSSIIYDRTLGYSRPETRRFSFDDPGVQLPPIRTTTVSRPYNWTSSTPIVESNHPSSSSNLPSSRPDLSSPGSTTPLWSTHPSMYRNNSTSYMNSSPPSYLPEVLHDTNIADMFYVLYWVKACMGASSACRYCLNLAETHRIDA